jgi:hypothetical protein
MAFPHRPQLQALQLQTWRGRLAAGKLLGRLGFGCLAGGLLLGPALVASPPPAASALELRGATYFQRPPWKVDLVSYTTTVGDPAAEYFFTVELAADAGASLGELTIQQTRGADWQFPFLVERTQAFLGRPRQVGAQVPVTASFDSSSRRFSISFPEPIAPGRTVTVMLKPWHNPSQSDTYMFQVTALPAGPNPSPAPLGFGTLRIYGLSDLL